jgi:replicative DNA helicase
MNTISALNEHRSNHVLKELVYKTFNEFDLEKANPKIRNLIRIVKHVSEVLVKDSDKSLALDLEETINECKSRENTPDIEDAKAALSHMFDNGKVAKMVEMYESFNHSLILNEKLPALVESIAAGTSMVDLPIAVKNTISILNDINLSIKKETYAKGHTEFHMIPGEMPKGLELIKNAIDQENMYTLYTGLRGIDEVIVRGGFAPGKCIIIGSVAGGGKSITMLDIMKGIMTCSKNKKVIELPSLRNKKPVLLLITYENTMLQTYRRLMKLFGLRADYLNALTLTELQRVMADTLKECNIGLIIKAADAKSESAEHIGHFIKELEEQGKHVLLVGHDYINLTNSIAGDQGKNNNEFMEAGLVTQELREVICKGMNKTLITAIQVRKEAEDRYNEAVRKGDKMPIRVFNGSSIFGGNITKQKADLFIFVMYTHLSGRPYAEILLDKARDGNGDKDDTSMHEKINAHLKEHFAKQNELYTAVQEEKSIKEFYGNDGRLAIAIPRYGLSLAVDKYYADRFEVNPEASKFMNMFEETDVKDPTVLEDDNTYEEDIEAAIVYDEIMRENPTLDKALHYELNAA